MGTKNIFKNIYAEQLSFSKKVSGLRETCTNVVNPEEGTENVQDWVILKVC
jgi:hypothetical protein